MGQGLFFCVQRCLQLWGYSMLFFSLVRGSRAAPAREHVSAPCPYKRSSVSQPHQRQGNSLSTRVQARGRAQPQSLRHWPSTTPTTNRSRRWCNIFPAKYQGHETGKRGGGAQVCSVGASFAHHVPPCSQSLRRSSTFLPFPPAYFAWLLSLLPLSLLPLSATWSFPRSLDLALSPFLLCTRVSPAPPGHGEGLATRPA